MTCMYLVLDVRIRNLLSKVCFSFGRYAFMYSKYMYLSSVHVLHEEMKELEHNAFIVCLSRFPLSFLCSC